MQTIDPKVMVAISAAIGAYIEEEAAMAMQQAEAMWMRLFGHTRPVVISFGPVTC